MSISFSAETKNDLCAVYLKKPCCKRAFLYGSLLGCGGFGTDHAVFSTDHEKFAQLFGKMLQNAFRISIIAQPHLPMQIPAERVPELLRAFGYEEGEDPNGRICTERMTCEYDKGSFLRGVFLACGTVNMPNASYHLELAPQNEAFCEALREFLAENGLEPKVSRRASHKSETLYYKDSEAMEDLLNFIGAQKSAFQLMNVKIMRDIRNNANRVANCDMANIDKTITAANRQMEAIWRIADSGRAQELPQRLKETFDIRAAHPDISLEEIAALHEPPISKSGASHRLRKLIEFAKTLGEEEAGENEPDNT